MGRFCLCARFCPMLDQKTSQELATLTCDLLDSRWYLLCAQIQGSGYYG